MYKHHNLSELCGLVKYKYYNRASLFFWVSLSVSFKITSIMKMIDFRLSRQQLPLCKAKQQIDLLLLHITALLFLFLFCLRHVWHTGADGKSTSWRN